MELRKFNEYNMDNLAIDVDVFLYNTGLQVSFEGENPKFKEIIEQINNRILSEIDIFIEKLTEININEDDANINYFLRDIHDDDTLMF